MTSDPEIQKSSSNTLSSTDGTTVVPRASIDWYRSLPWWRLLSQTVSISWRASHLLLAAMAMVLTYLGWLLAEQCFAPEGIARIPFSAFVEQDQLFELMRSGWQTISSSEGTAVPITVRCLAYFCFGVLWTIGIWSFAGGLLARRCLMEMGVRTSVGWGPSCRLVCKRWLSMVWAITMPLTAIAGLALLPFVIGIVARAGVVGQFIALVLILPALLVAIGIGWCAAISAFGFPLSICAISAEKNADAFDGVSRSAAYIFQRPMTILAILFLAAWLGWLGENIIRAVLGCGEQIVWWAFSVGFGGDIQGQLNDDTVWRTNLLALAQKIIPTIQAAFAFSFFWAVSAAAYLTLRWEIDHTDFDDLDLQELGEPVAVPQFKQDSKGVAEVSEGAS